MKKNKFILGSLLIFILVFVINKNFVQSVEVDNLEKQRAELKAKIKEAGENLENIDINLTENLEKITELDKEILEYENNIEKVSSNIESVEKQIKKTEKELAGLNEKYEQQKKIFQNRLVAYYEAGKTQYLDVLLNSKSMTDFISRYYLISEMAEYDKNMLNVIEKQKNQIEQIENNLKISRENQKLNKLEQKKIEISLENAKAVKESYANKLSKSENELKKKIDTYQDELDLIELEIVMAALQESGSEYVGGEFAWPAPGYYTITSKYGMRIHPILKTYSNHTGMDIGAPMGAYAISANDGIVTKATYSYSYGNMVMVDHGGGVVTLYGHASELLVDVGDIVKRGDPILKVGSTGWSTGPHLHFEIRINGKTIDPYPYVIGSKNESLN